LPILGSFVVLLFVSIGDLQRRKRFPRIPAYVLFPSSFINNLLRKQLGLMPRLGRANMGCG
jgi:hypothetical protein